MSELLEISTILPASPERIYTAWLNADEHSEFTGGQPTTVDPTIGGKFRAWGDYITGTNLILEPYIKIIQSWRTTEFPPGSPDSRIELTLKAVKTGTKLTLKHDTIPDGQSASYKQGWKDYYFKPMKEYFAGK